MNKPRHGVPRGRRRYPSRRKPHGSRSDRRPAFTPGADAQLKPVFATIGVPEKQPFKPDRFQTEAVTAIAHADCLVTAPTGAGKTWIAVKAIQRIFDQGGRAWYASPLKALTNAKLIEFGEIFGSRNVGILTGDRKERADAPIVVGTTEILRNQLYDAMHQGGALNTDLVVLDEAHFLGDEDRGVVWEETMIYLPARIPLLMLSATVGNAGTIASWLTAIRGRPCRVVSENRRPVPLYAMTLHPSGTLLPLLTKSQPPSGKLHKRAAGLVNRKKTPELSRRRGLPPFGDILRMLKAYDLLPAIFFLKSRSDCDDALKLCHGAVPLSGDRKARIFHRIAELTANAPHLDNHRQRIHLEQACVAAHHSGHLPGWKLVVENLMREGLLTAVFATSTVAAGVNFPARTVVFFNSDRFNGIEFAPLDATQLHQMTGRAGRRGMDKIGFVLAVPGRYMDLRLVGRLLASRPGKIHSRIRINFSMVLNLLLSHTPAQVEELLKRSFATWLLMTEAEDSRRKNRMAGIHEVLWENFQRHLAFLKETGFVDNDDRLTDDGVWASQLRVDQPLLVAECLRQGLLPETDPSMMAGVFACFVNERETDDRMEGRLTPNRLKKAVNRIHRKLTGFVRHMKSRGFDVRRLYLRPAAMTHAWAAGSPWELVARDYGMAEGNLAMLMMRTADNLRHTANLIDVFPEAAATAREAIGLIMKPPVIEGDCQ
ncbi:MAG: ATP-dependent DNA helicase [Proteobacteria bacterium]|nr:MAG: ATP-dependent DNA helicase [Pseudomonadota bacterium]PIE66953.1 MAG: ATP-dependent DNA helicase [Deltaproteobacteria bacterium]